MALGHYDLRTGPRKLLAGCFALAAGVAARVAPLKKGHTGALAGFLLLGLTVAGYVALALSAHAITPLTAVASGSMAPILRRGDLVYLRSVKPEEVQAGDIVAFDVPKVFQKQYQYPPRIIHRVTALEMDGDIVSAFQTKGDATNPDPFSIPAQYVKGRGERTVPWAGYALLYLQSKQGVLYLTFLLVALLLYEFAGQLRRAAQGALGVPPTGAVSVGAAPLQSGQGTPTVEAALNRFADSMQSYGVHLQTHTNVMMNLQDVTGALAQAVQMQVQVLEQLQRLLQPTGGLPPPPATEAPPQSPPMRP
ncbi:MAG: signal peptidase I [Chloroflexi bacterium]|nr:signal peptidase I [Chloroflexota bacterium]